MSQIETCNSSCLSKTDIGFPSKIDGFWQLALCKVWAFCLEVLLALVRLWVPWLDRSTQWLQVTKVDPMWRFHAIHSGSFSVSWWFQVGTHLFGQIWLALRWLEMQRIALAQCAAQLVTWDVGKLLNFPDFQNHTAIPFKSDRWLAMYD